MISHPELFFFGRSVELASFFAGGEAILSSFAPQRGNLSSSSSSFSPGSFWAAVSLSSFLGFFFPRFTSLSPPCPEAPPLLPHILLPLFLPPLPFPSLAKVGVLPSVLYEVTPALAPSLAPTGPVPVSSAEAAPLVLQAVSHFKKNKTPLCWQQTIALEVLPDLFPALVAVVVLVVVFSPFPFPILDFGFTFLSCPLTEEPACLCSIA